MEYTAEDGVVFKTGEVAYDYYSMARGYIGKDCGDGWFDFHHTSRDNLRVMLNGQRICSLEHARKMGWPYTESE